MSRGAALKRRLRAIAKPIVKAARAVWWVIRYGPPTLARWLLNRAARALAIVWLAGLGVFVVITVLRAYDTIAEEALVARKKEAEREQQQDERRKQLSKLEFRDIDEMEEARDRKLAELGIFEMPEEDDSLGECMMSPDEVTRRMRAVAKIRAGEELTPDDRKALQPPDPKTCIRAPKEEEGDGKKKKGLAGWIARNRKHMNRPVSDAMTLELLSKELKGFSKDPGAPEVSVDENGNLVVVASASGGGEQQGEGNGDDAGETPGGADEAPPGDESAESVADADSGESSDDEAGDDGDGDDDGDETGAGGKVAVERAGLRSGRRGPRTKTAVVVGRAVAGVDTSRVGRAALGALVPAVLALTPEEASAAPAEEPGAEAAAAPTAPEGPTARARLRAVAEALVIRAGPRDLEMAAVDDDLHVVLPANSFRPDRTATLQTSARWLVLDIGDVLASHEDLAIRVIGDPIAKKGQAEGVDSKRSRKRAALVAELLAEAGVATRIAVDGVSRADEAPHGDRVTIEVVAEPKTGEGL